MTVFQKKVLDLVKKIPKGRVSTYKQVAIALGCEKACRAVGAVLRKNPNSFLNTKISKNKMIPCHRVVKSDGFLGHYCGGRQDEKKKEILINEGIRIRGDRVDWFEDVLFEFK